ncbi:MAG: type IV pilus modification protein PilV [Burkholderiaceae bacterium]|nr:type IV pilus modification protein PilV [Burkholderiaceae bacterium]
MLSPRCTARGLRCGRGASLIEVLVALVLVAIVMLGLAGLQLRAIAFQKDSFDRRTAAMVASDFAERLASNFAGFEAGAYVLGLFDSTSAVIGPPPASCGAGSCTPLQVAAVDLWHLQRQVSERLPGGAASVQTEAFAGTGGARRWVRVVVGWIDPQRAEPVADAICASVGLTDTRRRCFEARVYP